LRLSTMALSSAATGWDRSALLRRYCADQAVDASISSGELVAGKVVLPMRLDQWSSLGG
jgi:hypothetical protein